MLAHHQPGDEGLISRQVPMQVRATGPAPPVMAPAARALKSGLGRRAREDHHHSHVSSRLGSVVLKL